MRLSIKTKKYLKILIIILAIYYGVVIFTPLSRWMADQLVVGSIVSQADVIIVLSGGSINQQYLSYNSLNRLVHGIVLWRQGKAPNMILSGGPPIAGGIAEAYLMADMAKKLGVSADRIFLDDQSLNTKENIANSLDIMKKHGWRRALLVTQALHMKRALQLAKEEGLDCMPASLPYRERHLSHYRLYRLVKREYLSMLADKLFGDRGFRMLTRVSRWLYRWKQKIFYY